MKIKPLLEKIYQNLRSNPLPLLYFGLLLAGIQFRALPVAIEQDGAFALGMKLGSDPSEMESTIKLWSNQSSHLFTGDEYYSIRLPFALPFLAFFFIWIIGFMEAVTVIKAEKRKSVTAFFVIFFLLSCFYLFRFDLDGTSFYLGSGLVAFWILSVAVQFMRKGNYPRTTEN